MKQNFKKSLLFHSPSSFQKVSFRHPCHALVVLKKLDAMLVFPNNSLHLLSFPV